MSGDWYGKETAPAGETKGASECRSMGLDMSTNAQPMAKLLLELQGWRVRGHGGGGGLLGKLVCLSALSFFGL
jgi:hypothetical protein